MADTPNSIEQIVIHLEYLRDGVDGINARLDAQNGRIRTAETDIAVLKDRQSEARKTGGTWGAGGGLLGGLLAGFLSQWMGK